MAGIMGSGCTSSGLGANVLSTQSTSDPEVVNGIKESMAFRRDPRKEDVDVRMRGDTESMCTTSRKEVKEQRRSCGGLSH